MIICTMCLSDMNLSIFSGDCRDTCLNNNVVAKSTKTSPIGGVANGVFVIVQFVFNPTLPPFFRFLFSFPVRRCFKLKLVQKILDYNNTL